MAQLAIAINVSGRVVCERRCRRTSEAPVASQKLAGRGVSGRLAASTALSAAAGRACGRYRRVRRQHRRVPVGSPSTTDATVQIFALRRFR
jgi:hypothetical protein